MSYKDSSGFFRRASGNYTVEIFKSDEIPATGQTKLMDMENKIKPEATENAAQYQHECTKSRVQRQSYLSMKNLKTGDEKPQRDTNTCSEERNLELPTPEFTEIKEDIYDRLYAKARSNEMPAFPVVSMPDRVGSDSDSEYDTVAQYHKDKSNVRDKVADVTQK